MKTKFDTINDWLDNNTGMFGQPLSYHERISDYESAFSEQIQKFNEKKRFVYKFYHAQELDGSREWTYIGEQEVNNQEELWELEEQFSRKYKSEIKFNKVKARW